MKRRQFISTAMLTPLLSELVTPALAQAQEAHQPLGVSYAVADARELSDEDPVDLTVAAAYLAALATRYLRQHPLQTALLVGTLSLLLSLPLVLRLLLHETEHRLHQRALSTPLVLGARASALDLVLTDAASATAATTTAAVTLAGVGGGATSVGLGASR